MSVQCQVHLILNNLDTKQKKAIIKALEPDNVNFPENLSLNIEDFDNQLVFNVQSYDNMNKLIGTVDEILEHIQVVLKVIENARP